MQSKRFPTIVSVSMCYQIPIHWSLFKNFRALKYMCYDPLYNTLRIVCAEFQLNT